MDKYAYNKHNHNYVIIENAWPDYPQYPRTTACLRFVLPDEDFTGFQYVYITDADMLFYPETEDIVQQHVYRKNHVMLKHKGHGLICYENFAVRCFRRTGNHSTGVTGQDTHRIETDVPKSGFRMPGVHFVTQEWFPATYSARQREAAILKSLKKPGYTYDECMLYDIHVNSRLPITMVGHENWRWHALHLGTIRNNRGLSLLSQFNKNLVIGYYRDDKFYNMLSELRKQQPGIDLLFQKLEFLCGINIKSDTPALSNDALSIEPKPNPMRLPWGFSKKIKK
jgi:hypothetical protein